MKLFNPGHVIDGFEIEECLHAGGMAHIYQVRYTDSRFSVGFPMAMKIGQTVFKRMADNSPDYLSADCQLSGRQIASAIDTLRLFQTPDKKPELAHPLTLLRMAYGL